MDRLSSLLAVFNPRARQVSSIEISEHSPWRKQGTPDSDIYLVQQGDGLLTSVAARQTQPVHCGDMIWIPQGAEHYIEPEQTQTLRLVHGALDFGPVNLNPLFTSLPECIRIGADDDQQRELAPLMNLMLREASQPRCGQQAVLNRLTEVLLVQVLRFLMAHSRIDRGVLGGLADNRLARALTSIHESPQQIWSVATLAQRAGMSRSAFNEHFRRLVGYPPVEYLSLWRMRLACRLLENDQLSVAQIGERLSYQSETAFRRAFRRMTGMTPGRYRSRQQKQAA